MTLQWLTQGFQCHQCLGIRRKSILDQSSGFRVRYWSDDIIKSYRLFSLVGISSRSTAFPACTLFLAVWNSLMVKGLSLMPIWCRIVVIFSSSLFLNLYSFSLLLPLSNHDVGAIYLVILLINFLVSPRLKHRHMRQNIVLTYVWCCFWVFI